MAESVQCMIFSDSHMIAKGNRIMPSESPQARLQMARHCFAAKSEVPDCEDHSRSRAVLDGHRRSDLQSCKYQELKVSCNNTARASTKSASSCRSIRNTASVRQLPVCLSCIVHTASARSLDVLSTLNPACERCVSLKSLQTFILLTSHHLV